jgi:hypothetical protein
MSKKSVNEPTCDWEMGWATTQLSDDMRELKATTTYTLGSRLQVDF